MIKLNTHSTDTNALDGLCSLAITHAVFAGLMIVFLMIAVG